MHRIGDQSKTDLSKSNQTEDSNLEECMQNIQSNLKLVYGDEEDLHLGSYNVNAISGFQSQYLSNKQFGEDHYDSYRQHFTSQQSNNDFLLEEKNRQIRLLNREIAELRRGQHLTQFEHFENYQKIIEGLKKELGNLQSKLLNKEATGSINQERIKELEQSQKDLQIRIDVQQTQLKEANDQIKQGKLKISNLSSQIIKNSQDAEALQQKYQNVLAENQNIKLIVEDLQRDLDTAQHQTDTNNIVQFIEQVLQTISQFIRQYYDELKHSEYNYQFQTQFQELLVIFLTENDTSILQNIERMSSLVIAMFEQLTYDIKQIDNSQHKICNMQQQIDSLEQMTVHLENVSAHAHETPYYHEKIIQNLEDLNHAQGIEIRELKDRITYLNDQLLLTQRTFKEEMQTTRLYEQKMKKQHCESLFLREIIEKLVHIIGNESTTKLIEQIQELQMKMNGHISDQIEIRYKLEVKESDLKFAINQNSLTMAEMIERRKEVEVLRNQLRNCQKVSELHKEKMEMLLRDLDGSMMLEKSKQISVSYLPKSLTQKLQSTMRIQ